MIEGMLGVLADAGCILGCGTIGLIARKLISEAWIEDIMKGIALCAIYIGIDGSVGGKNSLIVILSLVIGVVIGLLLDLGGRTDRLAEKLEKKVSVPGGRKGEMGRGIVASSLVFCTGSLSIVGSIQAGLAGDNTLLFTKAVMDGVSAVALGASIGAGVLFASLVVFAFEGTIVMLTQFIAPYLGDMVVSEIACVGSVILVALGFKLMGAIKVDIMNFVPGVFLPILLCPLIG